MQNSKLQFKTQKFKKSLHFALCTLHSWRSQAGQALITLLFFMIIAITITAAATTVTMVNSLSTSSLEQANAAYSASEAGAENALLRLLRDPNYTGIGDTASIDQASIVVQVTGTNIKIATSTAQIGNFIRKIQVQADYTNNILTVLSWKEI